MSPFSGSPFSLTHFSEQGMIERCAAAFHPDSSNLGLFEARYCSFHSVIIGCFLKQYNFGNLWTSVIALLKNNYNNLCLFKLYSFDEV